MTQLNYEPRVILQHANRLNRRADSMGVTSAIIGAVIGGFFGAVPLTSLGDSWPIPHQFGFGTLLAGVLIGALTGYVIGDARAFGYRLQAQSSLCQLHLERNTAALLADSYTAVPTIRPEPPAAPVFEYTEPEPEPAPLADVSLPETPVFEYGEPEPEPEPAQLLEVSLPETPVFGLPETPVFEYAEPEPEPEPEPAPLADVSLPETPVFEYGEPEPEPEPEPAPLAEVRLPEYLKPAPEPAPVAAALVPEYVEPAPEPISLAEAAPLADVMPKPISLAEAAPLADVIPEPISLAEATPEPISLAEATPEPVPLAEATPAPASARLGEAPPPDLDSMSLEEIAQLAKTGLI